MNGSHIAIPTILKVGKGALENLGEYIRAGGMKKAVIYFGNGLVEMFGVKVMDSLKESGIEVLEYRELDSVRIEDIVELAFSIDVFCPFKKPGFFNTSGMLVAPQLPVAVSFREAVAIDTFILSLVVFGRSVGVSSAVASVPSPSACR